MLNNISFLGMGDLAKELHSYLVTSPDFNPETNFFFYDDTEASDLSLHGYTIKYVSDIRSAVYWSESLYFLTISSGRRELYDILKKQGFFLSSFIHHTSIISPFASLGEALGISMPVTRETIRSASELLGHNFWDEGRRVENLGTDLLDLIGHVLNKG